MASTNITSSNTIFNKIYKTLYKAFGPQGWWPGDTPFEIMVGAILTQNTNWRNASKAIARIKEAGLMNPRRLQTHHRRIPGLIRTSGFYRSKSRCLRAFLRYYVAEYGGRAAAFSRKKTPTIRKELLSITGIGPETADSILLYALGRRVFVIDSYTRRVLSRHGVIEYDLPYDMLQQTIEKNLPASVKLYNEYHSLLVRTGKEFCRKNEPLCSACPLGTMSTHA
jgi:endonuclease-3 related protein